MPLITCPDCNNQVSDVAVSCPHCGRPMKGQPPPQKQHIVVEQKKRTSPVLLGCLAIFGTVFIIGLLVSIFKEKKTDTISQPTTTRSKKAPSPKTSQPGQVQVLEPQVLEPQVKWQSQSEINPVDDTKTVILGLEANSSVKGWLSHETPMLILRCKEKKTEAYINVGMAPNVESGNLEGATVTFRFDKEKAFKVNCSKSTDDKALFLPKPVERIKAMMKHDQMYFQFIPFNSPPANTTFTLTGLSKAIEPLRKECGW